MADTTAQAIARYAPNQRVAEALGLGALLEGGSLGRGPFAVGDSGHSHGPFQINDIYHHNLTTKQAQNPDYAVRYILPSYVAAAKRVPDSLWKSNPERAAELTAFYAERPAKDYYATENVHAKWLQLKGKIPGLSRQPFTLSANSSSTAVAGMSTLTLVILVVLVVILIRRK